MVEENGIGILVEGTLPNEFEKLHFDYVGVEVPDDIGRVYFGKYFLDYRGVFERGTEYRTGSPINPAQRTALDIEDLKVVADPRTIITKDRRVFVDLCAPNQGRFESLCSIISSEGSLDKLFARFENSQVPSSQ